jgi:hypothetical protein
MMDELAGSLAAGGNLEVVDRENLERVRKELNFQASGEVSDETAASIGKFLGARSVITGQLVKAGGRYRFRLSGINVETAVLESSIRLNVRDDRDFQTLLADLKRTPTATISAGYGESTQHTPNTLQPDVKIYSIGDTGPAGGIIFYDKGRYFDGWRYLEVAPAVTEYKDNTGFPSSRLYSEITDRSLGAGLRNTRIYLERFRVNNVTGNTPLHFCDDLVYNGFADWYLPSLDELLRIYALLSDSRTAGFQRVKYWTSTCYSSNSTYPGAAYFVDFSNGNATISYVGDPSRTRAVRRF